ncbi:amidohydrolase family protein [Kribbella sandramycini]|uniref:6-methylsalicylate decarboxylase n=1 Tax=Kribbella sandramycini TaxID=60450 RepID=A0A7Y4L2I2_9ACTN|nr:amidohydrolase family protein [Kribbella sandramycini]MBB6566209.1 hypothetical protein [Kribbella sandramycini]NOL43124.1 amidohydrolase family protein [Kribbella sandramycini]
MTIHQHYLPPEYVVAAERAGHLRPDGLPGWPAAPTPAPGVLLSLPSPGVHFGDDFRARILARRVNEYAAGLSSGFLASLPLPDVEGSLVELDHAFGALRADGVVLLTNAAGQYPGEPAWEPLWRSLNDRRALVLLHPTSPPQWRQVALDRPRNLIEFGFETARAVTDLTLTGILNRYPDIRFAVASGELLPALAARVEAAGGDVSAWQRFDPVDCCAR